MMKNLQKLIAVGIIRYIGLIVFLPVHSQVIEVSTSVQLLQAVNYGKVNDTVQLAGGTYIISQSLEPKAGMTIRGSGVEKTIIKGDSAWQPTIENLPNNETPSSYLINLGDGRNNITISDLSLKGPLLHGAVFGKKPHGLRLYNLHIEDFLWSGIRTFSMANGKIHDNTLVNAAGKIKWNGAALFLSWSVDCEFWNNHILKTDPDKKFFGFKGEKGTRCRFHHNTVEVSFSLEYPFENDAYIEIDHNYFSGVISIPKYGGGTVPAGGYSFHIHHNWLTSSYAIEGSRNGAIVDHNFFDFDTNSDGGNLITNHGTQPSVGPTHFYKNLIRNPGRGIFWGQAEYNNLHFYNNHVIANKTITPRNEGLFGLNEATDFSTVVIKNNIFECIDNPRPLMRNAASYNALIENNRLSNVTDSAAFANLQTGNIQGVPLDSINFYCGAYEQFHVSGWVVDTVNIAQDTFDVQLFVVPPTGGTVAGSGSFRKGEKITVQASPNYSYFFESWSENNGVISNEEVYSFTVTRDANLNAHFFEGIEIILNNDPEHAGEVSGDGFHKVGSLNPISAIPVSGFRFDKWTEADTVYSFNPDTTVLVTSFERNLTAHYVKVYNLILQDNPAESGIVEGTGIYDAGDMVMITAAPKLGFAFTNWTEADTVYAYSNDTVVEIAGDRTITANFLLEFSVQVSAVPPEGGIVTGGGLFLSGSETTLSAISNDGYAFDMWTQTDIVSTMNSFFTARADTTIIVSANQIFKARFYPFSAIQGPGNLLFSIYPNPVHNILYYKTTIPENQVVQITLKNVSGKELFVNYLHRYDASGGSIDLSGLEQGIYFFIIRSDDVQMTRKIVKF